MSEDRYIVTNKVECSACKRPLWKEKDTWYPAVEPELVDNCLQLSLYGGYGMFFDTNFTTKPGHYDLTLCHDCAHKLVSCSPYLTHLLKGGHFHGFTEECDEDGAFPDNNECITDFHKEWGAL